MEEPSKSSPPGGKIPKSPLANRIIGMDQNPRKRKPPISLMEAPWNQQKEGI